VHTRCPATHNRHDTAVLSISALILKTRRHAKPPRHGGFCFCGAGFQSAFLPDPEAGRNLAEASSAELMRNQPKRDDRTRISLNAQNLTTVVD
jgi:hypothetical protein